MARSFNSTLLALALLGCPSGPDSGQAGDSNAPLPYDGLRPASCDSFTTLGFFGIEVQAYGAGFSGAFLDRPSPFTSSERIVAGDCVLYGAEGWPYDCEPPCEGEEICGYGSECRAWPANLDVGTVTLRGTQPELVLEPTEWDSYYYTAPWTDPYAPGDLLTLESSGSDALDPFSLSLLGSPQMLGERFEQVMRAGQPLTVTWEPAEAPDGLRMRLRLSIDHHATTPAAAHCDSADAAGSVTVSSEIVDALIAAGATGIGTYVENATLTRASEAWLETDRGCMVFETASGLYFDVETVL